MTVLIADYDLCSATGGGQTVYRRMFAGMPDVQFTYFRDQEPAHTVRPKNVTSIACGPRFFPHHNATEANQLWIHPFAASARLAKSIGDRQFDLLEIPDYRTEFLMLPEAIRQQGGRIGKVVVALHGQCSKSQRLSWDRSAQSLRSVQILEQQELLLFSAADVRYGISRSNIDEWRAVSALPISYQSPLSFLAPPKPSPLPQANSSLPYLCFIGRTERRKGPDLFLELLWKLPRNSFGKARIIGDAVNAPHGRNSHEWLRLMAQNRNLDVSVEAGMPQSQLAALFAERLIVFVPSRYDTLNLVALEALFAGCPTAIGTGAGVCRLLSEELPTIPFTFFDLHDHDANVVRVAELLQNYDALRQTLFERLTQLHWSPPPLNIREIYEKSSDSDAPARDKIAEKYAEQMAVHHSSRPRLARRLARKIIAKVPPAAIAQRLKKLGYTWFVACYQWRRGRKVLSLPDVSGDQLRQRILDVEQLVGGERFGRATIWAKLSELEGQAGRELVSVSYALRVLRLTATDAQGRLPGIQATLEKHGYFDESKVVGLMYGPLGEEERRQKLLSWLDGRREKLRTNPTIDYERVDDRRGTANQRVAVIVSLYNAAPKMRQFLDSLQKQTLVAAGQVELILVDSNSPVDEYSLIVNHACFHAMPSIYVRTAQRETIQQAWNRGLSLSLAPYVTMLGADETILPRCLELLAAELDRRPELDWIQANSLVTETDPEGRYIGDVMLYDRRGYHPELVRLECCYLSFVGSLYRRNIHERFGYYDPSFRGAGDTEFKNRLLPFLQTDAYPATLGVFWNYPEIRMTQNPLSELEDYRAWHVFRTAAGVEYAHRQSTPQQILEAARQALGYRGSHRLDSHCSTDLEYAYELLRYLHRRDPGCFSAGDLQLVHKVLLGFRELDRAPWKSFPESVWRVRQIFQNMQILNRRLQALFPNRPELKYFNDERCEHINWCWSYLP